MAKHAHPAGKRLASSVGLPSRDVGTIVGVASSTLNYWVQVGLVIPSLRSPNGRRVEQWWTVEEVVIAQSIRALRSAGVSLAEVRRISAQLSSAGASLASTSLYFDGKNVTLVVGDGRIEATRRPQQGMLFVVGLPLKEWHKRASAAAKPFDHALYSKLDAALEDRRQTTNMPMKRLSQKPSRSARSA